MSWFYGKHLGDPLPDELQSKARQRMSTFGMRQNAPEDDTESQITQSACVAGEAYGCSVQQKEMCFGGVNDDEQCSWGGSPAYGAVYLDGGSVISVKLPGRIVHVTFDDTARFSNGIAQVEDGLVITDPGDYEISFTLRLTATSAAFATFMLQADGRSLPNGTYSLMLTKEPQTVSGSIVAELEDGAHVRIAVTSATVIRLAISGANLSVKRSE